MPWDDAIVVSAGTLRKLGFPEWNAQFPVWTAQFPEWTAQFPVWTAQFPVWTAQFPVWTAQFPLWKLTGKDSSKACVSDSQNCAIYSVFPSGMKSHSKIAQFNWQCIGPF
jgi:hypothetical protein